MKTIAVRPIRPSPPCRPRVSRCRALATLTLTLGLLGVVPRAQAVEPAPAPARVELVQSAPIETTLAEPGLRFAKDVWVELINDAKSTIDIAQFYLANTPSKDSDLEPVIVALERAAARGVKVRVLVSDKMVKQDQTTFERIKAIRALQVKTYDLSKLTGGILHAKYWVVDHAEIYVGSQNFDWRSLTHIQETGLRVRDAHLAHELSRIFDTDWQIADSGAKPSAFPPSATTGPASIVPGDLELVASPPELTPPGIRSALPALLELIGGATKTLRIQVLEYAPTTKYDSGRWGDIDDALRAAAKRGVRVELLVSDWNTDKGVIGGLEALQGVANFTVKVITLPLASQGFIPFARVCHSKYMVVDDATLWVGTSNWSKGYFTSLRNVELIVKQKSLAAEAASLFARLWNSSYSEVFNAAKRYPKPRKGG